MNFEQLIKLTPPVQKNILFQLKRPGGLDQPLSRPETQRSLPPFPKPVLQDSNGREPKGLSDIKVVNEFSPSEYVRYDSRASCASNLESSLCNDIRMWEQICEVDKSIIQSVEKGFQDIDEQIQSLAAQFDVCFTLQQKAEERFTQFEKIVRGTVFTKFSRSNCRKTMPRCFYYCSYWDALCWKPANERYPKQNQMISVQSILQVHTNLQTYRKVRKNFVLPQWADAECFLAIEAKKNQFLELLAPDTATRNLFAKVIESLVSSQGKGASGRVETNFMVTQYGMDVNNIRRMLDTTRQLFAINIERLKNSFVKTTQMMISEERQKSKRIKQKSQSITQKTKATVEELLAEKSMLLSKLEAMKRPGRNPEIAHLNELVQDILANNGDCSVQNESTNGVAHTDPFQDCCMGLERLRVHLEASQNIEVQLRQDLVDLQQHYQAQIVDVRQQQNKLLLERDDLIQANEELAIKLDQFQRIIEDKEEQFTNVVREMRDLQFAMQKSLRKNSVDQGQYDRSKHLEALVAEFRQKALLDDRSNAKLLGGLISLLGFLLIPQDLNLCPENLISNLMSTIPFISEEQQCFLDVAQQLDTKLAAQSPDARDALIEEVRSTALSLRYVGFKISIFSSWIPLECASPQGRNLPYRKNMHSTAAHVSSPPVSSTTRHQTQF